MKSRKQTDGHLRTGRRRILNKSGATLVEMVVTFALLGLFLVVACQAVSYCAKVYYQVKGVSYGRQIASTLMDKIVGELEGAQVSISESNTEQSKYTLRIMRRGRLLTSTTAREAISA